MKVLFNDTVKDLPDAYAARLIEQGRAKLAPAAPPKASKPAKAKKEAQDGVQAEG